MVDASLQDDVVFDWQGEGFLEFEDFRRLLQYGVVQNAELFQAVFLVFALLVVVFEAGGGPFCFEQVLHFVEGQAIAFFEFSHHAANGGVHHAAKG